MDIDVDRLARSLELAWADRDLGDVAEIIAALREPGAYGMDFRTSSTQ